jgi:hypothetical protein
MRAPPETTTGDFGTPTRCAIAQQLPAARESGGQRPTQAQPTGPAVVHRQKMPSRSLQQRSRSCRPQWYVALLRSGRCHEA